MIYEKLAAIQQELIAPKGQTNSFGKYNYRSCEDVLKALKPLLEKNKATVMITNDLECIGDRNYVKATVSFVDLETGEKIESSAHAREEETKKGMDGSQITGASSSYARKYALAGMFCIDNEKDSDATNKGEEPSHADVVKEAEARSKVIAFVNKAGMSKENIEKLCAFYKVKSLNDMTLEQCNHYLAEAEKKGAK